MADIGFEKLRQLRRVIEAVPDDRLHMRTFCEEGECGTAYCAAGWAAVDPWFRENTDIGDIFGVDSDGTLFVICGYSCVFSDLADLFGLTRTDADRLFGADLEPDVTAPHAVNKTEVLNNIDLLLAGEKTKPYRVILGK